MKKVIYCTLASILLISGCTKSTSSNAATKSASSATSAQESSQPLEVDKRLLTVEVTIPASFAEDGTTQEKLDEDKADGVISAKLNDDGSVTYVMTHEKHDELLKATADSINSGLSDLVSSGDYSHITGASADDAFKTFTLTTNVTTEDELGLDMMAAFTCLMYGGYYNALDEKDYNDVTVNFVTADGTLVTTYTMQDFLSSDAANSDSNEIN